MGQAISLIAQEHGCTISFPVDLGDDPAQGIDACDVVIDFSLKFSNIFLVCSIQFHQLYNCYLGYKV